MPNQLVAKMHGDPIFRDPDSSVDVGTPEVQFAIDRKRAADLNVKAADIARALNTLAAGERVSTFTPRERTSTTCRSGRRAVSPHPRQFEIFHGRSVARRPAGVQQSSLPAAAVANITPHQRPKPASGNLVIPLEQLVNIQEGITPASIARLNRQRQVTVSASIPPGGSESDALTSSRIIREVVKFASGVFIRSYRAVKRAPAGLRCIFIRIFAFVRLHVPDTGGSV